MATELEAKLESCVEHILNWVQNERFWTNKFLKDCCPEENTPDFCFFGGEIEF
jgi:hypothetical protein